MQNNPGYWLLQFKHQEQVREYGTVNVAKRFQFVAIEKN